MSVASSEQPEIRTQDVERLRRALGSSKDEEVTFSATLPRSVAEKVLRLLSEEKKAGAVVIPARNEFRTTEAAVVLGVSRPHLSRLLSERKIAARKVGNQWRIPAESIVAFQEAERRRSMAGMQELADFQNEAGFDD